VAAFRNINNLGQRVIFGLSGIAIIISAIVLSQWGFLAVFLLICILTILEFYKLAGVDGLLPLKYWGTFTGAFLFLITFLVESGLMESRYFYTFIPIVTCIFFINLYKNVSKPFTNIAYTFLGIIYVSLPFTLLNLIAYLNGSYDYMLVLGILLLLWASDTGAYFAGKKFGKTKLFERISPKKSWEGFIGGTLLNIIIAFCLSMLFTVLPLWKWLVIGIIISVAGTYGDLVESLFKRGIHIKDSGNTIPGHGGFLDRFDGLLLSVPFILAFLKLS